MQRAVIGFDRWTEEFSFAGGISDATFPVTNLNVLPLTNVWRSSDTTLAATQFYCTNSEYLRPLRMFGICRHNLSNFARYRLKIFQDVARTVLLYDSEWQRVWKPAYNCYRDYFPRPGFWGGFLSPAEKQGITATRIIWLDQAYYGRAVELQIDDQDNDDGFVSIGLFEISEGYQVYYNPAYGARSGSENRNVRVEAEGGVSYNEERRGRKIFQGTIQAMPIEEAKQRFGEFQRRLNTAKPFLWLLDADDDVNALRDSGLYENKDTDLMTLSAYSVADVPIDIREVMG